MKRWPVCVVLGAALAVAAVAALVTPTQATSWGTIPIDQVIAEAEVIVIVEESQMLGSYRLGEGIYTDWLVEVEAYLRPSTGGSPQLVVATFGGDVRTSPWTVTSIPGYDIPARSMLFLHREEGRWEPVGGPNGVITLDASGEPMVPEHQDTAVLADFLAAAPRVPPDPAAPIVDPPLETSRAGHTLSRIFPAL